MGRRDLPTLAHIGLMIGSLGLVGTGVEHLICKDPELVALDRRMTDGGIYTFRPGN